MVGKSGKSVKMLALRNYTHGCPIDFNCDLRCDSDHGTGSEAPGRKRDCYCQETDEVNPKGIVEGDTYLMARFRYSQNKYGPSLL